MCKLPPVLGSVMALHHIVYVSAATKSLNEEEVDRLLLSAREFNEMVNVTGILLYQKKTFFQLIEGPKNSVEEVYGRIKSASQHTAIIELASAQSSQRFFADWNMGFCHAPQNTLQQLSHAEWSKNLTYLSQYRQSQGIKLLLDFWSQTGASLVF